MRDYMIKIGADIKEALQGMRIIDKNAKQIDDQTIHFHSDLDPREINQILNKVLSGDHNLRINLQHGILEEALKSEQRKLSEMEVGFNMDASKKKLMSLLDDVQKQSDKLYGAETDEDYDKYEKSYESAKEAAAKYYAYIRRQDEGIAELGRMPQKYRDIVEDNFIKSAADDYKGYTPFDSKKLKEQADIVAQLERSLVAFRDANKLELGINKSDSHIIDEINSLPEKKKVEIEVEDNQVIDNIATLSQNRDKNGYLPERYSVYNTETGFSSSEIKTGKGYGIKLSEILEFAKQQEEVVNGIIHSHPNKYAAFSDDDIKGMFNSYEEGITKQLVVASEDVMSIDLDKVNLKLADEILKNVEISFDAVDNLPFQDLLNQPLETVKSHLSDIINNILPDDTWAESFRAKFNDGFDNFYESLDQNLRLQDVSEEFDEYILGIAKAQLKEGVPSSVSKDDYLNYINKINDDFIGYFSDYNQRQYQKSLVEIFSDSKYLKSGTPAIQLENISNAKNLDILTSVDLDVSGSIDQVSKVDQKVSEAKSSVEGLNDEMSELRSQASSVGDASGLDDLNSDLIEASENAQKFESELTEMQRATSGIEDYSTTDSVTGLVDEKNKLDEVATSAENTSKGKKKFSQANSEVAKSADKSTPKIKKEEESLDKLAEKSKELEANAPEEIVGLPSTFHSSDIKQPKDVISTVDNGDRRTYTYRKDKWRTTTNTGIKRDDGTYETVNSVTRTNYDKLVRDASSIQLKLHNALSEFFTELGKLNSDDNKLNQLNQRVQALAEAWNEATSAASHYDAETKTYINDPDEGTKYNNQQHFIDKILSQNAEKLAGKRYSRAALGIYGVGQQYIDSISKHSVKASGTGSYFNQWLSGLGTATYSDDTALMNTLQDRIKQAIVKSMEKQLRQLDQIANDSTKYSSDVRASAERMKDSIHNSINNYVNKLWTGELKDAGAVENIQNSFTSRVNRLSNTSFDGTNKLYAQVEKYLANNTNLNRTDKLRFQGIADYLKDAKNLSEVDLSHIRSQFERLKAEMDAAGKSGKSFWSTFTDRIKNGSAQFLAQYFSLQDFIRYGRQALDIIVDLDTQMAELRKVSNASETELANSFKVSASTAKDLGATVSDTISATADWSRLGYSLPDAQELARVSTLYKNVGDGISMDDANESLISTLQGYQMNADQAEEIVDKYNEVANNFAIDSGGIGEALQRSAASFNAANTDLSKSIALVTATNAVVQDPDSVGTMWKTGFVLTYRNVRLVHI